MLHLMYKIYHLLISSYYVKIRVAYSMNTFGFIITRHVTSETTNKYWNHSIKLINTFYQNVSIVIIDDNSNPEFVKPFYNFNNVEIIESEFVGRGELLPYYYYIKNKFFENAVILHDSVFLHKKINFNNLQGTQVLPLWFFYSDNENVQNSIRITNTLINCSGLQHNCPAMVLHWSLARESR